MTNMFINHHTMNCNCWWVNDEKFFLQSLKNTSYKTTTSIFEMMNITFAKRHTSIFLQPFDDKWRDLNISSRDLSLPSISAGVTVEMGMSLNVWFSSIMSSSSSKSVPRNPRGVPGVAPVEELSVSVTSSSSSSLPLPLLQLARRPREPLLESKTYFLFKVCRLIKPNEN